jgi:hypothetical protein
MRFEKAFEVLSISGGHLAFSKRLVCGGYAGTGGGLCG